MAESRKPHEYEPQDLIDSMSDFDPKAVGDAASRAGSGPSGAPVPGKSGPQPEDTPEQARREQKASEFQNNPERSRDDHLTRIGRGHQTHG